MNEQDIRDLLSCALVSMVVVALILRVSTRTVRGMIRSGKLNAVNVGYETWPRYMVKSESVLSLIGMVPENEGPLPVGPSS